MQTYAITFVDLTITYQRGDRERQGRLRSIRVDELETVFVNFARSAGEIFVHDTDDDACFVPMADVVRIDAERAPLR